MSNSEQQPDFESVKARLAEIAEAVDDENLSLDDALDLYEEAVALGLQASDLLETGIVIPDEAEEATGAGAPAEAATGADTPAETTASADLPKSGETPASEGTAADSDQQPSAD